MIPVVRQNVSSRRRGGKSGDNALGGGGGDEGEDEEEGLLDLERGQQQDAYSSAYAALNLNVPPLPPPLDDAQDSAVGKLSGGAGPAGVMSFVQRQEQEIAPIVSYHNLIMVQRATYLVFQVCYCIMFTSCLCRVYLILFYTGPAGWVLLHHVVFSPSCGEFPSMFSLALSESRTFINHDNSVLFLLQSGDDTKFLEFYQPISADYRFKKHCPSICQVGRIPYCIYFLHTDASFTYCRRSRW